MLTKRRTNIVGIVVSDMRNPFYPVLIERLTQGLQRIGFQSLLFNITPGASVEEQLVAIRTYNVDAVVIISATMLTERDLAWATEGRKAILLNRQSMETSPASAATTRLARGRWSTISTPLAAGGSAMWRVVQDAVGVERRTAFVTRLAELGLRLAGTVSYEAYSYEAGWRGALHLLAEKPDAIFFASDILALGGIDALRQEAKLDPRGHRRRRIRRHRHGRLAAIFADDLPAADRQIGRDRTELLSEGHAETVHRSIAGELIVRTSSVGSA